MNYSAEQIMNGTFGEVWLDGELVSGCYGMQAVVEIQKEEVKKCGSLGVDTKMVGYKGTGSIRLHKISTLMGRKIADKIKSGSNPRFLILSKLADPASRGNENVSIKDASFDNLTLADWESGKLGEVECPFTFTDFTYYDTV